MSATKPQRQALRVQDIGTGVAIAIRQGTERLAGFHVELDGAHYLVVSTGNQMRVCKLDELQVRRVKLLPESVAESMREHYEMLVRPEFTTPRCENCEAVRKHKSIKIKVLDRLFQLPLVGVV